MQTKPKRTLNINDLKFWKGLFAGGVIAFLFFFGYAALRGPDIVTLNIDAAPTYAETATFTVETVLGPNQVREVIDIYIDGKLAGSLHINSENPVDSFESPMLTPGRHTYRVVSLTHTNDEKGLTTHAGTGTGTIDVQEGDLFNVFYTPKANTSDWTMSLLER
jgi:hypothetical protein